jgi:hypothetical protein
MEWDMRIGQAQDALNDLRSALRLRSFLYSQKDRYSRGQRENNKSHTLIQRCESRVLLFVKTYRRAREAIESLSRPLSRSGWEGQLPALNDGDVKGMTETALRDAEEPEGTKRSEGHRELSWIWTTLGAGTQVMEDAALNDCKWDVSTFTSMNAELLTCRRSN